MAEKTQQLSEFAVIRSLKRFRDRYFPNSGKVVNDDLTAVGDTGEDPHSGFMDSLPVRKMLIKGFFCCCFVFCFFVLVPLSKNVSSDVLEPKNFFPLAGKKSS